MDGDSGVHVPVVASMTPWHDAHCMHTKAVLVPLGYMQYMGLMLLQLDMHKQQGPWALWQSDLHQMVHILAASPADQWPGL